MRLSTTHFVATLAAAAFLLPIASQAASLTADQINSVVSLLQSFNVDTQTVQTVQSVLTHNTPVSTGMMGSTTSQREDERHPSVFFCAAPMRNLGIGSRGDEVRLVQQMLAQEPTSGFTGTTTGYYGPMTAQAMMRFQESYHIASSTNGSVGPVTRKFLEQRCGKVTNRLPPVPGMGMASGTPSHEPMMPPPQGTQRDN